MLSYGLDDGVRMHEPEIYYTPKFREKYHKVIFDPNWISNAGDLLLLLDILHFFKENGIYIDAVMANKGGTKNASDNLKGKSLFDYEIAEKLGVEIIETPTLEDFCDLIYSAKDFYCFVTGSATLAAALRKPISVLVGTKNPIDKIFMHSPLHRYYLIPPQCDNAKRVKEWRIFGIRFRLKLTPKRIHRLKQSIRKRFPRAFSNKIARFLDSFKSTQDYTNLMREIFATPPQRRLALLPSHLRPCAEEVWNLIDFTRYLGIEISVVFEFGSRYGEDTIEFAKALPEARIYGFECNPNTLLHCQNATKSYKNITLTPKAISESGGEISFYPINAEATTTTHADGNQGASSTLRASGKYTIENYVQDEVKVEAIRLDDFMAGRKIAHIDILWMDIQGGELSALKSLGARLERVKVIYSEVEFIEIYENQPLFSDIRTYLEARNFAFVGFSHNSDLFTNAIFAHKNYADSIKVIPSWIYKPKKTLWERICKVCDILAR